MFKVHVYLDGKMMSKQRMESIPMRGDTVRFVGEKYGTVNQIVWCMDEENAEGIRVNIGILSEEQPKEKRNA